MVCRERRNQAIEMGGASLVNDVEMACEPDRSVRNRRRSAHHDKGDIVANEGAEQPLEIRHGLRGRALAGAAHFVSKASQLHGLPEPLFDAQLQVLTEQRAVEILLIRLDHRILLLLRRLHAHILAPFLLVAPRKSRPAGLVLNRGMRVDFGGVSLGNGAELVPAAWRNQRTSGGNSASGDIFRRLRP